MGDNWHSPGATPMTKTHPAASHPLPCLLTAPGESDIGDIVDPFMRSAGVLILVAAEATCVSKPLTIIAVGVVHAIILRAQALLLPIRTLVSARH